MEGFPERYDVLPHPIKRLKRIASKLGSVSGRPQATVLYLSDHIPDEPASGVFTPEHATPEEIRHTSDVFEDLEYRIHQAVGKGLISYEELSELTIDYIKSKEARASMALHPSLFHPDGPEAV
jgi:hypothetical protein